MTKLNLKFEGILVAAHAAGLTALEAAKPRAIIVGTPLPGSNEIDFSKKVYHEPEGVCGFAWIHIAGNTSFGRYMKAQKHATDDYPKGLMFWVREGDQSLERKDAYAHAFAEVLNANGVAAAPRSRMD